MLTCFVSFSGAAFLIQMIFPPIPNSSYIPIPYNGPGMDTADKSDWSIFYWYLSQKPDTAIAAVCIRTEVVRRKDAIPCTAVVSLSVRI
jgi:hypothetical protein